MAGEYIVIDGISHPVEIDSDGEYVGDPLELRGTNKLVTEAQCPDCADFTEWEVEFRGPHRAIATCSCGREWTVQS